MIKDYRALERATHDLDKLISDITENKKCIIIPGFVDVHVHLRQPGFSYKETVLSGTLSAARGGFTSVCTMPNLKPVPDSYAALKQQLDIIEKDAVINVFPYGAISAGERGEKLADMDSLAPYVCAFSDDGKGVQNTDLMLKAMLKAKALGKIIAAHCEDNSLLNGGCIHDGVYARENGYIGISSASEWKQVERDIELCKKTGCSYHVCHVSSKESVELIRKAKAEGVDITCETAPHYLCLNDAMLKDEGRFKMNPPIRSEDDRQALIAGICDGTVDMIATDHAPHSAEEKSRGLKDSLMGIVGLETAFAVLYTNLVKTGLISLEKLIALMSENPRRRFNLSETDDFTVFDIGSEYMIDPADFLTKGRATPFEGEKVYGRCLLTVCGGCIVWQNTVEND